MRMTATEADLTAVHAVEFDRDELRTLAADVMAAAQAYKHVKVLPYPVTGPSDRLSRLVDLASRLEDEWENPPTEVR